MGYCAKDIIIFKLSRCLIFSIWLSAAGLPQLEKHRNLQRSLRANSTQGTLKDSNRFENSMSFSSFDDENAMEQLWEAVAIARPVHNSLFTFGDSELQYYLVLDSGDPGKPIKIRRGEIKITKPMIITPHNARPEFQDFFEDEQGEMLINFLLARSAAFSNLQLSNHFGSEKIVSDQVEEVVDRLNAQLDQEEEEQIAILVAPEKLAGVALFKYATERVLSSAPDNLTELRERGFLPE